jgi:DNA-binding response OmpR family regulator
MPDLPDDRPVLLLIEDDLMVGRFIAHAAEECGYRAIRTTGLEGFRSSFEDQSPDVVAVDLCIPGCDGIEILGLLAEEKFHGTTLIVSGLDRRIVDAATRIGQGLGLHMSEPLAKPFCTEDLARRLRAAVAGVVA